MIYFFKEGSNSTIFFENRENFLDLISDSILRLESLNKQGFKVLDIKAGVADSIERYDRIYFDSTRYNSASGMRDI